MVRSIGRDVLLCCLLCVSVGSSSSAAEPTYWQDVRGALRKHCTVCHNARNLKEVEVSGGLALDSYDALLKSKGKLLVKPGKSAESLLVQVVVTADGDKRMPLGGKPLPGETVALLRRWVDSGAKEGKQPDNLDEPVVGPPPRRRKLDVTLSTVVAPGKRAPLQLALRVGPLAPVVAVVFSPDGKLLATGAYGRVTVWDLQSGKPLKVLTSVLGAVNDLRFSPDGTLLAVGGGQPSAKGDLRLFTTRDWKLKQVLPGHDDVVASVAFRHDGKKLASASFDKTVRVWDVASGKPEYTLTMHSDFVHAVAFSPDGKYLCSASKDRSVRLVDAVTGASKFTISDRDQDVLAVAVSPEHPVVEEKGDNNTLAKANPVPVPCVVAGRIEALEDVDTFKFKAKAGQTFTFEVQGARLQDKVHDLQKHVDPMLALFDAEGRELAANDDFCFADPLLAHTFAADGDYYVQVRDSKYDGDPRWVYALLITNRPHATHVFPMAGNPGKTISVEPVGPAGKVKGRISLEAPSEPGLHEVALDLGDGQKTSPVPFLVSTLPQVMEVEPNDAPAQATRVTLPCGINGRIGAPRDLDHYVFKASKGKAIRFEVKARRFGTLYRSSLDSVIDVMKKGVVLATNDDAFGKDSALVFAPPADGDYVLRIRDLNNKGGPTAVYYIEADWARPDFTVRIDGDKAMIGPGSRTTWFVQVDRLNGFQGPVRIDIKGLPQGVTVSPLIVPPTMTQGLLVLSADKAASRDANNVEVTGTAKIAFGGEEKDEVRRATPIQEIYFPGGGRGLFDVKMQTVAVTGPSDILDVQVSAAEVVLKPGEEVRLEVTIVRKAAHDKGVSLDVMLRHLGRVFGNALPPGVTLVEGKSKTLLGGGSKGHVVLRAAPTAAPIEKVPVAVLANVSINFVVKVHYASAPILVSVRK